MERHISVERLNEFCELEHDKAERLIRIIAEYIDFLPLGREEETFAEEINIQRMLEMLYEYD